MAPKKVKNDPKIESKSKKEKICHGFCQQHIGNVITENVIKCNKNVITEK